MTKKILRFDLVVSFLLVALVGVAGMHLTSFANLLMAVEKTLFASSALFLTFVMLVEPCTTPPRAWLRVCYGALVGFVFVPTFHIGSIYSTPELALLIGNLFLYVVSPKMKLILQLKKIVPIAVDTYDFIFTTNQKFIFTPGQYLEWTFAHSHPDSRGIRRYFTIASSPTEKDIKIGVKFYPQPSTFKNTLLNMKIGEEIIASQIAGDFVLPKNKNKKLVFLAGGIGITPFRSMIKYLVDQQDKRDITLFYSSRTVEDFAYTQDFDQAEQATMIKTIYTIAERNQVPVGWSGEVGLVSENMIKKYVPNYLEYIFYISGPHAMVVDFVKMLKKMGIKRKQIRTDFFPGFA